jgi:hypothetical protein
MLNMTPIKGRGTNASKKEEESNKEESNKEESKEEITEGGKGGAPAPPPALCIKKIQDQI